MVIAVLCAVYCDIAGGSISYTKAWSLVTAERSVVPAARLKSSQWSLSGQAASCRKVLHWENTPQAYSLYTCTLTCTLVQFLCSYIHYQSQPIPHQSRSTSCSPNAEWGGGGTFSTNSAMCKYRLANHAPESLQNTHSCMFRTCI